MENNTADNPNNPNEIQNLKKEIPQEENGLDPAREEINPNLTAQLREMFLQQEDFSYAKLHKNAGAEFVNGLSSGQKDKLLDILSKNEDNSFSFHTQRLNAHKEIELERIKRKGDGLRTVKILSICVLSTFLIITVLIALARPEHLIHWLAFLTGLGGGGLGGYGVAKSKILDFNGGSSKSIKDESEE